jgi:hypothetical protein
MMFSRIDPDEKGNCSMPHAEGDRCQVHDARHSKLEKQEEKLSHPVRKRTRK